MDHSSFPTLPPNYPHYATMPEWVRLSGVSRSRTYTALERGEVRGKKLGKRLLVDVASGLKWLDSLPPFEPSAAA
jgi:hypothetical protein